MAFLSHLVITKQFSSGSRFPGPRVRRHENKRQCPFNSEFIFVISFLRSCSHFNILLSSFDTDRTASILRDLGVKEERELEREGKKRGSYQESSIFHTVAHNQIVLALVANP
jgi:hypothetical protein